jgi:hypothetical protein
VQIPQQQGRRAEPPPEGTGEHARSALLSTPVSLGRHSPDQVRDMATELVGWNPGELPGQVTDQLAAWPPGPQTGADQPPTSAYLAAGALAFALSTLRYALAMPRSFSLVEGGSQLRPSVR